MKLKTYLSPNHRSYPVIRNQAILAVFYIYIDNGVYTFK